MDRVDAVCSKCGYAGLAGAGAVCPRCLLQAALAPPREPAFPRPFGKYVLLGLLGKGGMGTVFLADEPAAGRRVALKKLSDGWLLDPTDVSRFEDEARKAAALRDEGIVRVHDVGAVDGEPYFTMELMEGGSLAQRIADYRGRPRAAAALVADVARAVHHAHQRFVLHRDLKPANILLDAQRKPHIADFGIARRLDQASASLSSPQHLLGTLPYMAREQIQTPAELNVAVDVYGAGAILYELLCGQPPATGATAAEILDSVVNRDPPRPRVLLGRDAIDLDLDTICMKCLRKEPAERYASAAGLAADLDRYLSDDFIAARQPTFGERMRRSLRRHPAVAALVVTGVVLLIGTTVAAVSLARDQERELRAQTLNVNAYAARAFAGAVRYELRALEETLVRAASAPDVLELLRRPQDPALLEAWQRRPAPPGFDTWMVLDRDCRWIVRAPRGSGVHRPGTSMAWRDYCAGTAALGRAGARDVHVSRAHVSTIDGTARFSMGIPIYDANGAWQGIMEAAVDTTAALGSLALSDPREPQRLAVLVARRDRDRSEDPVPDDWVLLLHGGMARGSWYRMQAPGVLNALAAAPRGSAGQPSTLWTDDDYRDPMPGFGGRWLAGMAPVGDTTYATIVQTRYEVALAPHQRLARRVRLAAGVGASAGSAGILAAVVIAFWRRRSRRA